MPKPTTGEKLKQAAEKGWDALAGALADRPKPTGEWTAESVEELIGLGDYHARKRVADSHNAAVDAERKKVQRLVDALERLVNRLDKIHANEHYKSVWYSYANHGGDYSDGPTYTRELKSAKDELAKMKEGKQ
jgi:hypothetical protein